MRAGKQVEKGLIHRAAMLMGFVTALAVVLLAAERSRGFPSESEPSRQNVEKAAGIVRMGTITKIDNATIAIRDRDGDTYQFTVPATATITLNAKAAKLADLKPGHTAKITADAAGEGAVATLIDATTVGVTPETGEKPSNSDPTPAPAPPALEAVSGTLHMVGGASLVLLVNGEEQRFVVNPGTPVRKDGEQVQLAALAPRDLVMLAGERAGTELRILRVEARSAY